MLSLPSASPPEVLHAKNGSAMIIEIKTAHMALALILMLFAFLSYVV
jgi:hypothetical protein